MTNDDYRPQFDESSKVVFWRKGKYTEIANPPLDSAEGIAMLMVWARAHRAVLYEWHERVARKYGVSTEDVLFARAIPEPAPVDIAPDDK